MATRGRAHLAGVWILITLLAGKYSPPWAT